MKHHPHMTVAAHRGDRYNCYENTMSAFESAIRLGADMIETDVRVTKDMELVLIHDHNTLRTGRVDLKIADSTYQQLQEVNVGAPNQICRIPKLEELLALLAGTSVMLNLEIKEYADDPANLDRCHYCIDESIRLLEKYGLADRTVLNSFDAHVLEYIHKKYHGKYKLHGFYPYSIMHRVEMNPDDYLFCACIFDDKNKANYDYLIEKGIEPWVGAGVTIEGHLALCQSYGAKLVTSDNPADAMAKLKRQGLRV